MESLGTELLRGAELLIGTMYIVYFITLTHTQNQTYLIIQDGRKSNGYLSGYVPVQVTKLRGRETKKNQGQRMGKIIALFIVLGVSLLQI